MPRLDATLRQHIAADRTAGMSVKEIASKYKVNRSTISKYSKSEPSQSVDVPMVNLTERAREFGSEPVVEAGSDKTAALSSFFESLRMEDDEPVPTAPAVRNPTPRGNPHELIQRILLNAETFPDVFPNTPSQSQLAGKSVAELQGILMSMEHSRAVKMLSTQFKQVFLVCSRATEVLGKMTLKLRTDGMTDALLQQQAELDYLFRELAIKHADRFRGVSSPEVRLLTMFGITLLQTDATNRLKDRLAAAPTPSEVEAKYPDL